MDHIHRTCTAEDLHMIALDLNDRKTITSHLFLKDTFDHFCLIEGEIITFNAFHIDGRIRRDFFDADGSDSDPDGGGQARPDGYSYWERLRSHCLNLIRGKRTPLGFRFIFTLSPENIARLIKQNMPDLRPEDVQGLYLNFHFDGKTLTCVTGTSFKIFTPDRLLEHIWDEAVQKFFRQHQIPFEIK